MLLCTLAIGNLTGVVAEIKLAQVAVKMLSVNVMIHAIDATLESLKVTFDCICCNANAFVITHVLISGMINQRMLDSHPC